MHDITLPFDREKIERTETRFKTPFYIYDENAITARIKKIQQAFSWNEGYKEYFAVKATPNPEILKLLHSLGCGIDCASDTELMLGERLGITGEEIMFTSNDTPDSSYDYANSLSAIVNLDDCSHLEYFEKSGSIPHTVCFRYNPGTDFIVQNDIMGELQNSKFGMRGDQLIYSVKRMKELGAKKFGVHAMLASCALNEDYYPTLARELFSLALKIREETGVELSFVNLSGGAGIPYLPEEDEIDIIKIGAGVKAVYDELISANGMKLSVFTEMGRYVTGPFGYLVTKVRRLKSTYKNYAGVDATACNLMRPAIYGAYHHITVLGKENDEKTGIYDVTGSLCENNDKFAVDRPLPKLSVGDFLVIHDAGAHGYSMGYNYNGFLRCAELLLEKGGNVKLIRRAETAEDYFATFDIYPEFRDKHKR